MIDRAIHTRYRYSNNGTSIASIESNIFPVQWLCSHRQLSKLLSEYTTEDVYCPYYYVVLGYNYVWESVYKTTYWHDDSTINIQK